MFEKLFKTKKTVELGVFQCHKDQGLRVEVSHLGVDHVRMIIGDAETANSICVHKDTAGVLRDFFAELEESL